MASSADSPKPPIATVSPGRIEANRSGIGYGRAISRPPGCSATALSV